MSFLSLTNSVSALRETQKNWCRWAKNNPRSYLSTTGLTSERGIGPFILVRW